MYRTGLNKPLIVENYALHDGKQYEGTSSLTPVLRRQNLLGYQMKATMVLLNNDSLNHLDDYR